MSGVSAPRWPTWLDIAVQVVEKFRKPESRTRTVNTTIPIRPDSYSSYLTPLDAPVPGRVPNSLSEIADRERPL